MPTVEWLALVAPDDDDPLPDPMPLERLGRWDLIVAGDFPQLCKLSYLAGVCFTDDEAFEYALHDMEFVLSPTIHGPSVKTLTMPSMDAPGDFRVPGLATGERWRGTIAATCEFYAQEPGLHRLSVTLGQNRCETEFMLQQS